MKKAVLDVQNVNVYYKEKKNRKQIIKHASFTIYEEEMVGLIGASGSGKSTLCKCILGLIGDYEGEIIHYTKRPQMVFQDSFGSLNPKKKIGWILEEPLRIQKIEKELRIKKVNEMMRKVQLEAKLCSRYPRELSGGQRQRVSIALAILTGAMFILLDESLSALDVTVQAQIIELIKELKERYHLSFLFVSHDLDVINTLCHRVLYLEEGHVKEIEI